MKRILLILVLCLLAGVSKVSAQTVTSISDIQTCPDLAAPNETIYIGYKAQEILAGADPVTHIVTFFGTLEDAQNNTNALPNQEYVVFGSQMIYARLENTIDSSISYYFFQIIVFAPSNITATLVFCDPSELPLYDLTNANPQFDMAPVMNWPPSYFLTFSDAQNYTNPLPNPLYAPTSGQGVDTVYIRYFNTFDCESIGTIVLETNLCNTSCSPPINLIANNITQNSIQLNWTNTSGTFVFHQISVVPQGNPPSTNNIVSFSAINSYTVSNLTSNTCYSIYLRMSCTGTSVTEWSAPFDICMTDCSTTGQCDQAFVLNAFIDTNNNSVKDDGESDFPYGTFNYQINDSGTTINGYNNTGLYYIYDDNPSNSYDVSFALDSNLSTYYACTTTYTDVTLPTGSGANTLYFPVTVINPHIDASVSLYTNNSPRPGFSYSNYITYKNNGTLPIASGTITFTKDNLVTINSISQTGTTPTANGFTYDFTNLQPFETRYITVTLQVPTIPTVQLGDLLTNSVSISADNDLYLTNNTASVTQTVVGSYDPNDKMESHGRNIVFEDFTANDYLTYTIRFENTGTANAEFIRIEDALDSQLDENTFELISASHQVNVRRNGTQLTFHFYAINLPPSSINIDDGHGYVQFKIKPKPDYDVGDIIPNTASIFFDYNPPIVTNTFETEFVESLSTSTFTKDNVVVYPNPANDFVQVALNNSNESISSITITDILGKTILEQKNINSNQTTINTSSLAKGMYLLKITSGTNASLVKKVVKQ
ncbi:T9SS type A sorting domain-containing protein [Flavobacterium capsici]|uniref:T9SS type A sorting domain-containing protein n=1 Tax=Flavobacterium capsici TaxID=3075618 RepID=A0AA96F260_9FLAO|nr:MULTISPECIES: T9SS type A sorting domain-containing protein [unclassified Flavobacterium]WNM19946.1 T9SS type A sorting domain-containing protein [Flavobacterium sp. PMR2A8]WNM21335.1 T9SS type A sorting domain-containing protein [Flavobacterium sp. PMTSA4]